MQRSDPPAAPPAADALKERATEEPARAAPAIIGRYEVLRTLGEGAMGRVLLARDPVLDRKVAIKHLRGDLKIPSDVREGLVVRMRHEARAAARVSHPNLVTLHDMGEDPDVGLYLVFEYVEGPTLKQRIARGRMLPAEVARLARQLGDALSEAHGAGIVHRDVKPDNVILARTGAKIADFGIARIPDSTLTHQGGLLGTPAYSAPETFKTGAFSPASDQFSLAATVYEALSGARAFPGDDAVSVATKIANEAPPRFAERVGLRASVDEVLERALAREPAHRYRTCAEFGDALASAIEEAASRREPLAPSEPPRERKTSQVILGAIVVAITAALLFRSAFHGSNAAPSEPVEPSAAPIGSGPSLAQPSRPRPPKPRPRPDASTAASATPVASGALDPPRASASASPPATSSAQVAP